MKYICLEVPEGIVNPTIVTRSFVRYTDCIIRFSWIAACTHTCKACGKIESLHRPTDSWRYVSNTCIVYWPTCAGSGTNKADRSKSICAVWNDGTFERSRYGSIACKCFWMTYMLVVVRLIHEAQTNEMACSLYMVILGGGLHTFVYGFSECKHAVTYIWSELRVWFADVGNVLDPGWMV